ncbi:MAG: hypothetical protein AW07_04390 [Candidatus Accumulibacter sp. SK-11]|nr:MAG: hypothetical protein AW07_04390 [Candidatus Accumulibacter sp. SK-11]
MPMVGSCARSDRASTANSTTEEQSRRHAHLMSQATGRFWPHHRLRTATGVDVLVHLAAKLGI